MVKFRMALLSGYRCSRRSGILSNVLCRHLQSGAFQRNQLSDASFDSQDFLRCFEGCFQSSEFAVRRHKLMDLVSTACVKPNIVLFPAASTLYSTYDVPVPFRQNSEFLYLTGLHEPDCILVTHSSTNSNCATPVCALFVPEKNAHKELWEGPQPSHLEMRSQTGVDQVHELSNLDSYLTSLVTACGGVNNCQFWLDLTRLPTIPTGSIGIARRLEDFVERQTEQVPFESPTKFLHRIRWRKSPAEIDRLRRACAIGAAALQETMRFSRCPANQVNGVVEENVLCAKMDFETRIRGARCLAYPPVIAGGERANIIHYLKIDQKILPGELVLMDAGSECGDYVSDITRTWPISRKFSPPQRLLYEALHNTQMAVLRTLQNKRPISLSELYKEMLDELGRAMQQVGLLKSLSGQELSHKIEDLCPHHVSHYLGIDVHDTDTVARNIPLESGVVITVEPGLYIRSGDASVPEEFRGTGMRLEDDVLITDTGIEVLTAGCAKSVADIEAL